MKKSKDAKRNKAVRILLVLALLCVVAAAYIVIAGRASIRQRWSDEALSNSLLEMADSSCGAISYTADSEIESFITAERVYPHGHTGRDDEHTFEAYDAAVAAGAHYVEPDVVISADGTLYVSHDLTAARITGDSRPYAVMSDAEIDELTGRTGDKIHKLSEVFERYGRNIKYLVELKSADSATIEAFQKEVDAHEMADLVILQSEFPEALEKLEEIYPGMPKMLIVKTDAAFDLAVSADYIDIAGARVQFMTKSYADRAHNAGKKLAGWPIDSEAQIRNAISIGADAYFTNDTALALKLERELRPVRLSAAGADANAGASDDINSGSGHSTILFASDYQAEEGFASPGETLSAAIRAAAADGKAIDAAVLCGDYTNDPGLYDYQLSPEDSISEIRSVLQSERPALTDEGMIFVQGNHDALTESIAESGLHEFENYFIYVLNTEQDFPWKQGKVNGSLNKVRASAAAMKEVLDGLIGRNETKPVFIAGHVPLHYTARTSSRHTTGDNLYSSLIFDVVNEAAKSLDIVYLFGHNHSKGWDCYMGGAAVYKAPGDTLLLSAFKDSDVNSDSFEEKMLNFTYLNAGYVGYYMNCEADEYSKDPDSPYRAADETLTCTVCEVYEDRIEITRYDANGRHVLGAAGEANPYKGGIDEGLIDSRYYSKEIAGPAVIYRK